MANTERRSSCSPAATRRFGLPVPHRRNTHAILVREYFTTHSSQARMDKLVF